MRLEASAGLQALNAMAMKAVPDETIVPPDRHRKRWRLGSIDAISYVPESRSRTLPKVPRRL